MKKNQQCIVGGGLAGLAAAYTLAKAGHAVTLIEQRDRLGGRVHTRLIEGVPVDFGGFIIHSWYTEYHRLLRELGIDDLLEHIPLQNIFYELSHGTYTALQDVRLPLKQTLKLLAYLGPAAARSELHAPELHSVRSETTSETLRRILKEKTPGVYERFIDLVFQGYCYAPAAEYETAFLLPLLKETKLRGDVRSALYLKKGNVQFIRALEEQLRQHSVDIRVNTELLHINDHTLRVRTGEAEQEIVADNIVFAQPLVEELAIQIDPSLSQGMHYTRFYTIVVEHEAAPEVNGSTAWDSVFYLPEADARYQVLTSIALGGLYSRLLSTMVMYNVRVHSSVPHDEHFTALDIFAQVKEQIVSHFPRQLPVSIVDSYEWQKLMPVATTAYIETIRSLQGKNGYYFAGDYLGAPSMETALRTGIFAAEAILKTDAKP